MFRRRSTDSLEGIETLDAVGRGNMLAHRRSMPPKGVKPECPVELTTRLRLAVGEEMATPFADSRTQ